MPQEDVAIGGRRAHRLPAVGARLLCLTALSLAAAAAPAAALPGGGGIRIDGAGIPASEVWAEYNYLTKARQIIHSKPQQGIDEQAFGTAVAQVTNRNLLAREAGSRGIALTPGERADLRALQVAAWKSEANFQTALAMLGLSEADFLHRAELNQLARKAAEADVRARGPVTEKALRAHYQENLGSYLDKDPELRYLLLSPKWGKEEIGEFLQEAQRLRKEGKTYESLVRRHSIHQSAASGGVVGKEGAEAGGWPHPDLARNLKPGRISGRAREDSGGISIYVRDILTPLPYEQVHEQVRKDHWEKAVGELLRSRAESLRRKAKVQLLEGSAPSPKSSPKGHR